MRKRSWAKHDVEWNSGRQQATLIRSWWQLCPSIMMASTSQNTRRCNPADNMGARTSPAQNQFKQRVEYICSCKSYRISINTVTYDTCDYRRGLDSWPDLLITCIHHTKLQIITALSLITLYKSQHTLSSFQSSVSSPAGPYQRLLTVEILQVPAH
jgi:hypothetical protein